MTISLWKGKDRKKNIEKALELVEDDLKKKIIGKKRILIKPNFVSDHIPLAATHVDAVRAVLDFIVKYNNNKVIIGEGSAHETAIAFRNFGYLDLKEEYDIEFLDLNNDRFIKTILFRSDMRPMESRVSKTVVKSDCRISVCPMKTHDNVIVTLSLKNLAVGSLIKGRYFPASRYIGAVLGNMPLKGFKNYKAAIHQGYPAINRNIFELAKLIPPHISVLDGFIGMEGNGPVRGKPVKMELAVAGSDFLAVDWIGARLMGFNPENIGYLFYCKQAGLGNTEPEIIGNITVEKAMRKFRPHFTYKEQLKWNLNQSLFE